MIAQANYPAGAAAAVPTSVQRPPPPLQNAPSTPVAPNQARMIAQTNYPAGAAASAPPAMQHLPHPLQNTPSAPVAPNQARMIAQANYPAGAATSDPTSVQHPPPPLQNAPSAPAAPNQAQNNTAPTRQSRTIEAAADMLVQLIRDTAAVAATGAAADQAQNAQDKAQWVALLGKKERELEVERAERRKEVEEQRAQWQMEHRAREEEAVRSSRQIEQAERALLQREAEFEKERTQWREQRDSWARNLEQADRDKQEISQRLEMASNFEEERAQWEKIREALESEKTNNSQQIDQLRQQISLLTEKETKFGEERAEWEKERDAWKGETARVMKLFEQAEEQITQCLEKEKKFADERAQWGEEREALEADKARKSEEIGQLQKSVKVLDEKLRHSQVVGQTNGTETQKGAEQSQQRQGQVPSTFDVKAAETQEQGSTIQKLTERISSQDAYIARINAVATEKLKALQESSKQLREQNAVLVANAQRISQVLATYVNKTREWQTISKAVKSANAPSSLLAAKNAEVSVAWSEMERIVAALAAQGLPAGVGAQKPQPQGPNMPAMATEK
ncbi:hypothetical protein BJ912DRAFT_975958 [Pholiota molesta]|nr:hypothetical protein BJ912DRAFT_975958 [Pholiota molesta]